MHVRPQAFDPRDFIEQINSNRFVPPVSLTGWLNVTKETVDSVPFSPSQSCAEWIDLPVSLIQSIEHLGTATCDHHHHPIVRLHLLQPSDESQQPIFALLGAVSRMVATSRRMQARSEPSTPRDFGPGCRRCMEGCLQILDYEGMVDCSYNCMGSACA